MNNIRLLHSAALVLVLAASGSARGDIPQSHPMVTPNLSAHDQQRIVSLDDVFTGLDLSNEQRAEVQKIRQNAEARRAAIAKNQNLDHDEKDAMIAGCTRLEYSQIFRALTPGQQQLLRERIRALQAAQVPNQKPNAPRN